MSELKQPDVVVLETAEQCDEVIGITWPQKSCCVVGFDCEYTASRSVACLQLCDSATAVIVRLSQMNGVLPGSVARVLGDPLLWKAGVGVHDDAYAVAKQYPKSHLRRPRGLIDVAAVALAFGISTGRRALGDLAEDVLGEVKTASGGGWEKKKLGEAQKSYAAKDAWLGLMVARKMRESLAENGETEAAWLERAAKASEKFVERHSGTEHRDSEHAKAIKSAPKRAREAYKEKRQAAVDGNVHRKRLEDSMKKRRRAAENDAAVEAALKELQESAVAQPAPVAKRKQPKATSSTTKAAKGDPVGAPRKPKEQDNSADDGGFTLNII